MKDEASELDRRIAERVRGLRAAQRLSLEALAGRSGVSRSMISLVERGESSPTAALLEKLAAGLNVTLASLFDAPHSDGERGGPVARRAEQRQWRDPASGYVRRNVTPAGVAQPMQIVEVEFPARGRVGFDPGPRDVRVYQQVWVLEGEMEITVGEARHRLRKGDCLAMELGEPTMFHNPGKRAARYAVVIAREAWRKA